ncbi:hypothetical protein LINPERPRIM_LOCUS14164 [Linum perenne]
MEIISHSNTHTWEFVKPLKTELSLFPLYLNLFDSYLYIPFSL